jgi:hypothetical protein
MTILIRCQSQDLLARRDSRTSSNLRDPSFSQQSVENAGSSLLAFDVHNLNRPEKFSLLIGSPIAPLASNPKT